MLRSAADTLAVVQQALKDYPYPLSIQSTMSETHPVSIMFDNYMGYLEIPCLGTNSRPQFGAMYRFPDTDVTDIFIEGLDDVVALVPAILQHRELHRITHEHVPQLKARNSKFLVGLGYSGFPWWLAFQLRIPDHQKNLSIIKGPAWTLTNDPRAGKPTQVFASSGDFQKDGFSMINACLAQMGNKTPIASEFDPFDL